MTTNTESRAPVAKRPRTLTRWLRSGGVWAVVLALPITIFFAYFSWGPIVRSLILSFQKTNFLESSWVGFDNFAYVLTDPLLPRAVLNTLEFVGIAIVVGFPLSLFLAVFMAELRRTKGFASWLAYLPVVIPPVVAILLWKQFYLPEPTGLFNTVLGWVGIPPQQWLDSTTMVIPSMALLSTWAGLGSSVVIYIAALGGVSPELYEAAELDNAGIWRRVWHVTLPQIRGILLLMLLLLIVGAVQVFNEPKVLTAGGPNNASVTVLLMIYNYGFQESRFGAAAALSVLLAVALAIVSAVFQLVTKRWSSND